MLHAATGNWGQKNVAKRCATTHIPIVSNNCRFADPKPYEVRTDFVHGKTRQLVVETREQFVNHRQTTESWFEEVLKQQS